MTAPFERQRAAFEACGRTLYRLTSGDDELVATRAEAALGREGDAELAVDYPLPAGPPRPLAFHAVFLRGLSRLDAGYGAVLTVVGDRVFLGQALLRADAPTLVIPAADAGGAGPPRPGPSFGAYFTLGVRHIATGYDHLLFLVGLLIMCRRPRAVAVVVTCFTLAHALTLALAATNVVTLSSRIVEPLIAASVVAVGVENLVRGEEPRARAALAFAFGLVHGLGFVGALRDVGLGAAGAPIAPPLVAFNLGVEVGQLAVALPITALAWGLRRSPRLGHRAPQVASLAIAVVGLIWLVERLAA